MEIIKDLKPVIRKYKFTHWNCCEFTAIEDEFNSKYIEEVIERALDKALSSPTWTGGTDNPFKELADYLNTHSESKNYIIKKMYDYLGITELKNNMIENIKNSGQLKGFRGNKKPINKISQNARADGYLALRDYLEKGYLKLTDKNAIRQLEYIKKIYRPNGLISIQDKGVLLSSIQYSLLLKLIKKIIVFLYCCIRYSL